jgi:hypothetical protein
MRNFKKHLVLAATALGFIGAGFLANRAEATTGSDDLYSESIYIHKSAAEVPESLDSNASPQADRNLKGNANRPIESMGELDTSAASKKITQRDPSDNSLDN